MATNAKARPEGVQGCTCVVGPPLSCHFWGYPRVVALPWCLAQKLAESQQTPQLLVSQLQIDFVPCLTLVLMLVLLLLLLLLLLLAQ